MFPMMTKIKRWHGYAGGIIGLASALVPIHAQDIPGQVAIVQAQEIARFPAEQADQGVGVDECCLYAVDNRAIGRYDKHTGAPLAVWQDGETGPFIHLDSAMVRRGRLYAAHSNYSQVPMTSSIEVWNTDTLTHVRSQSLGIAFGSATWVDFHAGQRYVGFANYGDRGGTPGHDARWTQVVRFDRQWRFDGAWVFPPEVLARFATEDNPGRSNSGGSFGPDGLLYVTGHDRPEVYGMALPEAGSVLVWKKLVQGTTPGQGIAWDRSRPGILVGVDRDRKELVTYRVPY